MLSENSQLRVCQMNLNKLLTMQLKVFNTTYNINFNILIIQEPYINFNSQT